MLADFIYYFHTWVIGFIVVGIWTGLALLGLRYFTRRVDVNLRHKDTETVGLTFAIVAMVYGVMMAIIVLNVIETFSKSDTVVTTEANRVNNILIDANGLPQPLAGDVRAELGKYLNTVIHSEWPKQHAGKLGGEVFDAGWVSLAHLNTAIATFEPATMGQNTLKGEMLHGMNDLIKARRARILAAGEHLPAVVWKMLLLGGAISVIYTYFFGAHSYRIHVAITGLIAITISVVFVLIIALDYPFRGVVSVSNEAYIGVQSTLANLARADRIEIAQPDRSLNAASLR